MLEQFAAHELTLPEGIADRFDLEAVARFHEFLIEGRHRFFSRADQERILSRHLVESLIIVDYVASHLNVSRETSVADAGSGPGLPGYLFACLRTAPRLTLIDSSARSLGLLEKFHRNRIERDDPAGADADRVRFRYERLEEIEATFDLITCRALFPFPGVVELICSLQKPGGHFAIAGADLPTDDPRVINRLDTLGYVSRETITPVELKFLGQRNVFLFRKVKQTKKGYPRQWKRIKEAQQEWERQSQ